MKTILIWGFIVITAIYVIALAVMIWYDMYRKNPKTKSNDDGDERFDGEGESPVIHSGSDSLAQVATDVEDIFAPVKVYDEQHSPDDESNPVLDQPEPIADPNDIPFTKRRHDNLETEPTDPPFQDSSDEVRYVDTGNVDAVIAAEKQKIQNEYLEDKDDHSEQRNPDPGSLTETYMGKAIPTLQNSIYGLCGNEMQNALEHPEISDVVIDIEEPQDSEPATNTSKERI